MLPTSPPATRQADDIEDRPVARRFLTQVMSDSLHLTVQRCNWKWKPLEGKPFDDILDPSLRRRAACRDPRASSEPARPGRTADNCATHRCAVRYGIPAACAMDCKDWLCSR